MFPTENITQVGDFTRGMIGSKYGKAVGTKGAETLGFFLFLLDELVRTNISRPMLDAGQQFERMLQIWAGAPWRLGQTAINDSFECFSQFVRLTKDVPDMYVPKRHMLMHMLRRSIHQGNPGNT